MVESVRVIESKIPSLYGEQREWGFLWKVYELPPRKIVASIVFTVPSGNRLLFNGGYAFCSAGVVQRVWLTPGVLGDFYFSRLGTFAFMPSSEVKEKKTAIVYFRNNAPYKCSGGVSLFGILERML